MVLVIVFAVVTWIAFFVSLSIATMEDIKCIHCGKEMIEYTPPSAKFMAGLKTVLSIGAQLATGLDVGGVSDSKTKMKCMNCSFVREHIYIENDEINHSRRKRRIPLFIVATVLTIASLKMFFS